jgi:uncharacterized paraquat-inducible protein A
MLMRILTFVKSLWWHIYRGFPKSSKQQILFRYGICSTCEYFDDQKSQCLYCGCNVNTKKIFMNKLAWADQKCPINKWDKI